jgi:hypothetical protein
LVTYDGLLGGVVLGGGVSLVVSLSDAVDLVVNGSTVVVTVLTSTGNSPLDVVRVPGSDTGDLAETLVGLARELLGSPTGGNTLVSVSLGDSDDVDDLVLLEDGVDRDGLLEESTGEVNLLLDGSSIDLDLHQVGLLLLKRGLADLGVGENADNSAVLLDTGKLVLDVLSSLGVLLGVLGESLLLRLVPVLVEATADLVGKVLSPDGGERAESTGGLDVSDNSDDDDGGSLDDGDGLNDLLLVHLGARTLELTNGGGHTGLVTKGGGQVDRLLSVILGEGLYRKYRQTSELYYS